MTMSLVTVSASAADDGFKDADKINNTEAVEVLAAIGVIGGYGDGTFRPQATLTRGAGAKFIAYLVLGQEKADKLAATYTVFSDVDDSVGLAAYIEWAAAAGIVQGYGDGRFGPYDTLTQYAFGKMLLAALGYDATEEGYVGAGWQKNVYTDAFAAGIYDGTESYTSCDRETAARFALGALKAEVVVYGKLSNLWVSKKVSDAISGTSTYTPSSGASDFVNALLKYVGISSVEGAIGTGVALWENYEDLEYYNNKEQDIFGRPGHAWTYGDDFSKFYMDAPVAEYTEEVEICDVLVDCGYAKTKDTEVKVNFYVDGEAHGANNDDHGKYKHNANCEDTFGGQGTLTQVFEIGKNEYIATEIHTFLGEVESVQTKTHSKKGESELDVWYAASASNKAANTKYDVTVNDTVAYDKYDYVLVQYGAVPTTDPEHDEHNIWAVEGQYDADVYASSEKQKDISLVIVGEPSVIENAKFTAISEQMTTAKVAGNLEKVAYTYSLSDSKLDDDNFGTKYNFFVDQYGNIIGDVLPDALYTYGVLAAVKWDDQSGSIWDGGVARFGFISAAAEKVDAIVDTFDGEEPAKLNDDSDSAGWVSGVAKINSDPSKNDVYYDVAADQGVVKYFGDGVFERVDKDYIVTKDNATVKQGNTKLLDGDDSDAVFARVDNETIFLVKTETDDEYIYTSYVGKNEVPSISGAVITAVWTEKTDFADFVYIDATDADFTGENATMFFMWDNNSDLLYEEDADFYFNAWDGDKYVEDIKAVSSVYNTLHSKGNGIYKLSKNADGTVTKVEKDSKYTKYTVYEVAGNDMYVTDTAADSFRTDDAVVYVVTYSAVTGSEARIDNAYAISNGSMADIAKDDVVYVKVDDNNSNKALVIYVLDLED